MHRSRRKALGWNIMVGNEWSKAVFGIASSVQLVESIVAQLKTAGISSADISVLCPDSQPEGCAAAALRSLPETGSIAVGDLGRLVAGGPLLAAVAALLAHASADTLRGALVEMGIPPSQASRYEAQLRDGNILISVHTNDLRERGRAKGVFEDTGARDISYVNQTLRIEAA